MARQELLGDAFMSAKCSENCLHCSYNTWTAELRISDLMPLRVTSEQVATDTSFVLGQASFCHIITGKRLSADIIK